MKRTIILSVLFAIVISIVALAKPVCASAEERNTVDVYFFFSSSCPHCAKESYFLSKLESEYEALEVHRYEVGTDQANAELLFRVGRETQADVSGVPFTAIGDRAFTGFLNEETTGKTIKDQILNCMESYCFDVVGSVLGKKPRPEISPSVPNAPAPSNEKLPEAADEPPTDNAEPNRETESGDSYLSQTVSEHPIPESIPVPFIGNVKIKNVSLPAITIVIGFLDGFNPCAMWVLLFLISLLIGMENKRRMWTLGSTFIAASAFIYFLFMTAWLNALLFLGLVSWVRAGIAALAIAAGGYHLHAYIKKPESGCEVVGEERRKRLFTRMRDVVSRKGFLLAIVGIIGLAFAINLIELLCSAGFPVIYTQLLTMTNLPLWQYYAYLLLYILIFMLDDLFVFIIAMKTLHMVGISTKYSRINHFIGGILMIVIGLLLFLKPAWLMFG